MRFYSTENSKEPNKIGNKGATDQQHIYRRSAWRKFQSIKKPPPENPAAA
jgi:hypothetical protein